jgi:glyoxylase-like metal-dependent hydrolase (beta-lactamase superfamily II)
VSSPEGGVRVVDLEFMGEPGVIAALLVDLGDGFGLVDCGPASTFETLAAGIRELGLELADLRHLLLTHIHLDHAGAAALLVRESPHLRVHVSEVGAPHVVDPTRLERSARRLYGEALDALFGPVVPVPAENVSILGSRVAGMECFPTPGHAAHHVCFMDDSSGLLFAGDALGLRLGGSRYVLPTTPPPEVDLETWHRSLDEIEQRAPERLALPHFGLVPDPEAHLRTFRRRLMLWTERVRRGAGLDDFVEQARGELASEEPGGLARYELAGGINASYLGLKRYWDKQAERQAAG